MRAVLREPFERRQRAAFVQRAQRLQLLVGQRKAFGLYGAKLIERRDLLLERIALSVERDAFDVVAVHFALVHRRQRRTIVRVAEQQLTVCVGPIRQRLQIRDLEQHVVARNTLARRDANLADDAAAWWEDANGAAVGFEKTVDGFFPCVVAARDEYTERDDDRRQQQRQRAGRQAVRDPR